MQSHASAQDFSLYLGERQEMKPPLNFDGIHPHCRTHPVLPFSLGPRWQGADDSYPDVHRIWHSFKKKKKHSVFNWHTEQPNREHRPTLSKRRNSSQAYQFPLKQRYQWCQHTIRLLYKTVLANFVIVWCSVYIFVFLNKPLKKPYNGIKDPLEAKVLSL